LNWRFFWIFLFIFINKTHASCDMIDDAQQKWHVDKPRQRIISLAPNITEIIFAIGAEKQLVGVISGSDYPIAAKDIPVVGSYLGLDIERIVALHPDAIIVWDNTFAKQLSAIKKIFNGELQVYYSSPKLLNDIPHTIKNLGCLTARMNTANRVAQQFTQKLNSLPRTYPSSKKKRVFFQVGAYSLMTINKESWINQAIEFCGGKNIFAEMSTIAAEVSWEAVIAANPDVILSDATENNWKDRWQKWQNISAVREGQLYSIPPDLIERASPRLVEGVERICRVLHARS